MFENKNLKYWFYFFAVLDLLSLKYIIFNFDFVIADKSFLKYIHIIVYSSFIFSAYLLFERKKLGLIINFIQFPIRLFLAISSFGFLDIFINLNTRTRIRDFFVLMLILEILRLISEIIVFKKSSTKKTQNFKP